MRQKNRKKKGQYFVARYNGIPTGNKNFNADVNNEMKNMEQEILNESGVREKVSLKKRSYIIIFMRMVIRECSLVKIQLRVK